MMPQLQYWDPVWSAKSFIFFFGHDPSLGQSWGILTLIVIPLLLNCNYLIGLCTFRGSNYLKFQVIFLLIFLSKPMATHVSINSKTLLECACCKT